MCHDLGMDVLGTLEDLEELISFDEAVAVFVDHFEDWFYVLFCEELALVHARGQEFCVVYLAALVGVDWPHH